MHPPAIPEHPDDARSLRDLLHLAARVFRTQVALAQELCVDPSTVSKYLSGDRSQGLGWHVVVAALRGAAREVPTQAPHIVEAVAARWLDLRGRWTPAELEVERDWDREAADLAIGLGDLHRAVRDGDEVAVDRVARELQRELDEAITAARQSVRRDSTPTPATAAPGRSRCS